jgi:translocation protein SEC63
MSRIAVPPFTYSTFDKPVLTAGGEPTYNVQTIRMQFGAPPSAGDYGFIMNLINDSYIGLDIEQQITLTVEDVSRAEEIEDEGEISEAGSGKSLICVVCGIWMVENVANCSGCLQIRWSAR